MSHPGYDGPNTNPPEDSNQPAYPFPTAGSPVAGSLGHVPRPPAAQPSASAYSPGSAAVPAPAPPTGDLTPQPPPVPTAPTYNPAAAGQPYSAQPYSAQPYSAQPYSAQPYGSPPSSYPYGGTGLTGAVPAQPERRGRAGMITVSILMVLFLVAAFVLGTLFYMKNSEARKLDAQVTQLNGEVRTYQEKVDSLQKELDNAKRDLTDSKGQVDEITNQKKVVVDCVNAIKTLSLELEKSNGAKTKPVQDATDAVQKKCSDAEKYL